MFKGVITYFSRFKYGLSILFLVIVGTAFFFGTWWGSRKTDYSVFHRQPPVSEEEKIWREKGQSFADGLYFVESDIKPGIYRTKGIGVSIYGCQFQRLSGFEAEDHNVIARYRESGSRAAMVEILPTDKGFRSQGCGYWYFEDVKVTDQKDGFGDGAFIVGSDIKPGTYRSEAPYGCYWERLAGFSHKFRQGRLLSQDPELLATSRQPAVTILPSDKGFISHNCVKWTPAG